MAKKNTRFKPGQSGNPRGRPKGSRNRVTKLMEELFEGEAEEIARVVIEKAKNGDTTCLRLVVERLCPALKERPVTFELPALETADAIVRASEAVLRAVSEGDLTPGEASSVGAILRAHAEALATREHAARISELEERLRAMEGPEHAAS